jgi:ATP-dependent DNA ligase
MEFGRRSSHQIPDPIVEPLWNGIRVLAHVEGTSAELVDADGERLKWPLVSDALPAALQTDSAVLDGYLTVQATNETPVIVDVPTIHFSLNTGLIKMFLGGRMAERAEAPDPVPLPQLNFDDPAKVSFVAVDLLAIDGEPLLDVPLLERKRILSSVLAEDDRVRCGVHVRMPLGSWLNTWRSSGFLSIAYKDANSRYRPGEPNDDWATADIPARR